MSGANDQLEHSCPAAASDQLRGQGGFVVITALAVWLLVGGAVMIALLNMTLSVSNQAAMQAEDAQQARAIDGALETAVAPIQIDPSGRIGQPSGKDDGSCEAGLDNPKDDLLFDDGLGNTVTVTASCSGSTKKGEAHRVDLVARLDGARTSYGTAVLEVVKAKGPGNNVAVQSWTIGGDATGDDDPASTTSTTTTTTTTTVPASDVTTVLKVTAQWESGYCANVDVTNNGRSTTKWTVTAPVQGKIYTFWNGEYTRSGDVLTVSGVDWNRSLKSGESTSFGFCSNL